MPLAVAAPGPTTVLPYSLAASFQMSRSAPVTVNIYRDRSYQRYSYGTGRRTWSIEKGLGQADLTALRNFYTTMRGPMYAFYFYDYYETVPPQSASGYDMTGAKLDGRYTVRFDGTWSETWVLGRTRVGISLIQLG